MPNIAMADGGGKMTESETYEICHEAGWNMINTAFSCPDYRLKWIRKNKPDLIKEQDGVDELLGYIYNHAKNGWNYTDCHYAGPTFESIFKSIEEFRANGQEK